MPPRRPLFSRISRSIQDRVSNNPDRALAKYLWLWQSMGTRPGQRLVPRPIRFFFVASLDLFSLVGWYVRNRILRVARSAITNGEALAKIGRAGVLLLALGVSVPPQASGQDQKFEAVIGRWEGKLNVSGDAQLKVVFNVERSNDGGLTGTMECPDQNATVVPLSSVTFSDGKLTLVASSVPGSPRFEGTQSEDGTTLSGTFSQGQRQLLLELRKRSGALK